MIIIRPDPYAVKHAAVHLGFQDMRRTEIRKPRRQSFGRPRNWKKRRPGHNNRRAKRSWHRRQIHRKMTVPPGAIAGAAASGATSSPISPLTTLVVGAAEISGDKASPVNAAFRFLLSFSNTSTLTFAVPFSKKPSSCATFLETSTIRLRAYGPRSLTVPPANVRFQGW